MLPGPTRRALILVASVALTIGHLLAADSPQLRVATFRADATPPIGSPFYIGKPLAKIEDTLWAKGVVLGDGAHRYVLCALDWCAMSNGTHLMFRRKLAAAAGTDVSRVAVQTVHQHTAPFGDRDTQELLAECGSPLRFSDPKVNEAIADRVAAAVAESLATLQPFDRVGTGQAKVERVASSRRIRDEAGKLCWRASGAGPAQRALPEGTIDPMLKTITFARGDKPLVRLHYYATHPQSFYGDARACSDVPGFARERLEREEGVFQVYFTGCAGDVAMGKYNDRSRRARTELANRLFAGMKAAVAATRFQAVGPLTWRTVPVWLPPKLASDKAVASTRAKLAADKPRTWGKIKVARLVTYAERKDTPPQIAALQLGSVHIVNLPNEPMLEFQLYAQRVLPDHFVAVAGYGDLTACYVCTDQAFAEGLYEPGTSNATKGSEAALKAAIRQALGLDAGE